MNSSWRLKFFASVFVVLVSIIYVLPNFTRGEEDKGLAKFLPNSALRLGLDLQGGIHMVLGIDLERALLNEAESMAYQIKKKAQSDKIEFSDFYKNLDTTRMEVDFVSEADKQKFESMVSEFFPTLEISSFGIDKFSSDFAIALDLRKDRLNQLEVETIQQALETLRNRLDEFGVAEPTIVAKGKNQIVVQLPGMDDPDRAREILSKTAILRFQVVSNEVAPVDLASWLREIYDEMGADAPLADIQKRLEGKLPSDTELLFEEVKDPTTGEVQRTPYVVTRGQRISGELLEDARLTQDEYGMPAVSIRFNAQGAKDFAALTKEAIGKQLAIVLDDKIVSAPTVQAHITGGESQITFGSGLRPRNEVFQEAKDLALVLRSGALPAPIEILQNKTVGPSLGKDSIEKGLKAMLLGFVMIVLFMMVYYRASGLLANIALAINILFVVACLGMLNATLTLPGIAGILVSIGMAVDANIIIFERIREELSSGRPVKGAIELGYEKAHVTILDSNLTTIITGLILFYFGTGPIKGFAVTLIFGLIANYITALWFTRLGYEWWVDKKQSTTLSI
ncbi:MAG: protein translocase subunit SecD [Bdellovibrionales bacterium]|nr:protein translocase subunit SecD [Bdellovibrionales bacterium]